MYVSVSSDQKGVKHAEDFVSMEAWTFENNKVILFSHSFFLGANGTAYFADSDSGTIAYPTGWIRLMVITRVFMKWRCIL